jgi:hypothetical protein
VLSVFRSGKIVWENVEEDDAPRHIDGLDRSAILTLLTTVVDGDLGELEAEAWTPRYYRTGADSACLPVAGPSGRGYGPLQMSSAMLASKLCPC